MELSEFPRARPNLFCVANSRWSDNSQKKGRSFFSFCSPILFFHCYVKSFQVVGNFFSIFFSNTLNLILQALYLWWKLGRTYSVNGREVCSRKRKIDSLFEPDKAENQFPRVPGGSKYSNCWIRRMERFSKWWKQKSKNSDRHGSKKSTSYIYQKLYPYREKNIHKMELTYNFTWILFSS